MWIKIKSCPRGLIVDLTMIFIILKNIGISMENENLYVTDFEVCCFDTGDYAHIL